MILFAMQFSGDWENDKDRKQWLEKLYPKMLKSCERTFKHQAGIVYKKELKFLAVHQFARPVK